MGRTAKLRIKNGRWFSEAGGKGRYYGRADTVPLETATRKWSMARACQSDTRITIGGIVRRHLAWVKEHRSARTHEARTRYLNNWLAVIGESRKACDVQRDELERYLRGLASDDMRWRADLNIRAMFRWARRQELIPQDFDPFRTLYRHQQPIRTHVHLITHDEVRRLLDCLPSHLQPIITVLYRTGARPGELVSARVSDWQSLTRQIVLTHHKRASTQRAYAPRVIQCDEETAGIIDALVKDRRGNETIFRNSKRGRVASTQKLCHAVRRYFIRAKFSGTLYSLRHLWISEALMAGLDVMLVAKLAGTSVMMIDRVYGRFRVSDLQRALSKIAGLRAGE